MFNVATLVSCYGFLGTKLGFAYNSGLRFGYDSAGKATFVDCVQVDDDTASLSIWQKTYLINKDTIPLHYDDNNQISLARSGKSITNQNYNYDACLFDRLDYTNEKLDKKFGLFAIRAFYHGVIPNYIDISFRFSNKNDFNLYSYIFTLGSEDGRPLYLWWLVDNQEGFNKVSSQIFDQYGLEYKKDRFCPLYLQTKFSIYLWEDYDPLFDADEALQERKNSIYHLWNGECYSFVIDPPNEYSSSGSERKLDVLSFVHWSYDKMYPFK